MLPVFFVVLMTLTRSRAIPLVLYCLRPRMNCVLAVTVTHIIGLCWIIMELSLRYGKIIVMLLEINRFLWLRLLG